MRGDRESPTLSSVGTSQGAGVFPTRLTGFIGREATLRLLRRTVSKHRLVSLVGPGGCGKTRLAIEWALQRAPQSDCPVFFIDFSGLSDPVLVPDAVLRALNLQEIPGQSPVDVLVAHLSKRGAVLILDNCEHVLGTCAPLAEVLAGRTKAKVLATSRERLEVEGEAMVLVGGLELPQSNGEEDWLERSEAGRLFIERARNARADFCFDEREAVAIAGICQRLDGIPLAIELAAARVALMSVGAISDGLSGSLRLLSGRQRLGPPRHKTLRASIEWSVGLLTSEEKSLLYRLSVFASGFTLEAAEAVSDGSRAGQSTVLDLLTYLVAKSLVQPVPDADRFRLHEMMRAYAASALDDEGLAARVRDRHLAYFLEFAGSQAGRLYSADPTAALVALERELGNLRAALDWSTASGSFDKGAHMMNSLHVARPRCCLCVGRAWAGVRRCSRLSSAPRNMRRCWSGLPWNAQQVDPPSGLRYALKAVS